MRVFIAHDLPQWMLVKTVLLWSSREFAKSQDQLFVKLITQFGLTTEECDTTFGNYKVSDAWIMRTGELYW